ncbi:MAG TPA: hypothetical protein VHY34_09510 [Caulobacteraceae bacterium]|jgi:hypothetical protein|nr:hypothetical protein [Caulobacteraceae bacterium]
MTRGSIRANSSGRWFIALAALALLIQVLVPQGFMVSAEPAAPGLVICTGHGPLVIADRQHPAKAPKSKADAPCAFAAHGTATPPPAPLEAIAVAFVSEALAPDRLFDLAPGRGLAAPPPPSHGPPALLS